MHTPLPPPPRVIHPAQAHKRSAAISAETIAALAAQVEALLVELKRRDDDDSTPPAALPMPNRPHGPRPFATGRRTPDGVMTITAIDDAIYNHPRPGTLEATAGETLVRNRTADERISAARDVIQRTARGEAIPNLWSRTAWEQERADFQLARNTFMEASYGT